LIVIPIIRFILALELQNRKEMKTTDFLSQFPDAESMNSAIRSFESSIESSREGMAHRMKMYYDCVDDYSYGGICDKAASDNISENQRAIELLKGQIESKTFDSVTIEQPVLADLEGNIVSERIIVGIYGPSWIIGQNGNAQFVSATSKRAATYENKGYKVMNKVYAVDYYFTTKMHKGSLITISRIKTCKLQDTEDCVNYDTREDKMIYFAINRAEF